MPDTPEAKQLFANLNVDRGALLVQVVGPNFGEREGPIVQKMIATRLDDDGDDLAHVVMDFSDVGFMNSSGLGSCVLIHRQASAQKKKVVLYGLSDDLVKVFKMTRMDQLFKIAEDEQTLAKFIK